MTMRFAPHSRRFDPRWLFPGTETDGEEASDAPDVCPFSSDDALTSAVTERELDLALQQVALERCCVCPLCGALVKSDGTVLC
jgi:hypothetical protein